jgi:hypothetical protein
MNRRGILSISAMTLLGLALVPGSTVGQPKTMGPFLQVGGQWDIRQSNGFRVSINITQVGDQLSAFASHSNGSVQSTEAKGFVRGPDFDMTITWDNRTKGHYTGKLTHGPFTPPPKGFLKGHTVDLANPGSQADWESEGLVAEVR